MLRLFCMVLLAAVLGIPAVIAAEPAETQEQPPPPTDGDGTAADQPVVEEQPMTQAELAVIIVRMLGLDSEIDQSVGGKSTFGVRPEVTPIVYIDFLRKMGIHPLPDWDPNAEVTKEVLAVVLGQVLGLTGLVHNPADPNDWIAVLEEHDIVLTNIREVLSEIEVTNPVVQIPLGGLYQDNLSTIRGG